MHKEEIAAKHFSPDTLDFLYMLSKYDVRYMIVGGQAVIYYGFARLTGDIDIFYDRSKKNTGSLYFAIDEFWTHNIPGGATATEFEEEGLIVQYGVPPNRIDLINKISGVDFQTAWDSKITVEVVGGKDHIHLHYLSLKSLIKNKRASARPKDLHDLTYLEKLDN